MDTVKIRSAQPTVYAYIHEEEITNTLASMRKPSIKEWSESDRPREKLISSGKQALSDAELLAIIIRSGTVDNSALDIARTLLADVSGDLHGLGNLSLDDFRDYEGIGTARAITIVAALELGRRRHLKEPRESPKITQSRDAYHHIAAHIADREREEIWALFLNRQHRIVHTEQLSIGGVSATLLDKRILLRSALRHLASGIILCHNHPSGQLRASQADIQLTREVDAACKLMQINLLDHLIITQTSYLSMRDEGLF